MVITFRVATAADLPAIVALLVDDVLGATREAASDDAAALDPRYVRAFAEIQRDANNEMMVLESDGDVVGCLQLTYIPGLSRQASTRAQIESVRVASHMRGHGLGRRLFDRAIARARERGCHIVQLTSDKRRTEAHRFYESLGFSATHDGFKLTL